MDVYNKNRTKKLDSYDLNKGYLKQDTLIIHHEAVEEVKEISHYITVTEYPNGGRDRRKIIDTPYIAAKPAYDEPQPILVYIPYTKKQLEEINLNKLRSNRKTLLDAFDKWEKAVLRNREEDDPDIMEWFQSILDLNEEAFENIPERILYYKVD